MYCIYLTLSHWRACVSVVAIVDTCVFVLQDNVGLRGVFAVACAVLTLPVFGLLAFTFVPPLVSTIWLGVTYSFAAVSSPIREYKLNIVMYCPVWLLVEYGACDGRIVGSIPTGGPV